MAEVGRYDEKIARILKILGQELAIPCLAAQSIASMLNPLPSQLISQGKLAGAVYTCAQLI